MTQQKTWSADFKENIVLTVLRGEDSVSALARQHGISDALIHRWKAQFLEAGRQGLADGRAKKSGEGALENENSRLKQLLAEKELE